MKITQRSRLADLASEVTTKGYFARAQQRAARRRSPWNLLDLVAFVWVAVIWWALVHGVWAVRNLIVPQRSIPFLTVLRSQSLGPSSLLVFLLPLFAAIPVGMLLSNFILQRIPPYRRACEREAHGVWHASYGDAQKDLSLLALCLSCPLLLISLITAVLLHV
jgi:hypothetical protein